jgi:hypothetical protein
VAGLDADAEGADTSDLTIKGSVVEYGATQFVVERLVVLSAVQVRPLEACAVPPEKKRPPKRPRRSLALLHFARERPKKVCGLRGFARRREDGSIILLEESEPMADIFGVAKFSPYSKMSAEKRCI